MQESEHWESVTPEHSVPRVSEHIDTAEIHGLMGRYGGGDRV